MTILMDLTIQPVNLDGRTLVDLDGEMPPGLKIGDTVIAHVQDGQIAAKVVGKEQLRFCGCFGPACGPRFALLLTGVTSEHFKHGGRIEFDN